MTTTSEPDSWQIALVVVIAIVAVALILALKGIVTHLRSAATGGQTKGYKQDITELVESAKIYVVENSTIFLILATASVAALATWSALTWVLKAKQQRAIASVEDLVLAIASGLVTAVAVLFLTDYSAKRAQEREFSAIRKSIQSQTESLDRALTRQAETFDSILNISASTGLRIFPSIAKLRLNPETIFKRYLLDGETVRASSNAGHRWMALSTDNHVSSDRLILPLLRLRPCELRLLVHCPVLNIIRTLDKAGHPSPRSEESIRPILIAMRARFSERSVSACLHAQLSYAKTLKAMATDRLSNPCFKLVIRVSPEPMYSDFFVIQDRCVFAAYPMHSRVHQQALSVSVRDQLFEGRDGCPPNEVAASFVAEFDHFWNDAIDYQTFRAEYQSIIENILIHREMLPEA